MARWRLPSVPLDIQPQLGGYLQRVLEGLGQHIDFGSRFYVQFEPIGDQDVPLKPQEGMLIYVQANVLPGNQKGLHVYDGTDWVKL